MRYERPSSERGDDGTDSLYGDSSHETRGTNDERRLYGEPCHEVASDCDEQTLYGEPQHEAREERRELPDLDLLFARMRAESAAGPAVLPPRSDAPQADATEE